MRYTSDITDKQWEIVLKCYYILHYNADRIAAETNYSARHVRRLLKSGLETLQAKYNNVDISDIERSK